jgi:hypothetical protein
MHNRLKHIVFAVLLLILPLQGLAAALTPILCHSDEQQQTVVSVQAHGSDPSSHEEPTSNHDGKAGADYSGHLCCHYPVGAMPVPFAAFADSGPSTYVSLPQVLPSLFSPEQQLRPPRG